MADRGKAKAARNRDRSKSSPQRSADTPARSRRARVYEAFRHVIDSLLPERSKDAPKPSQAPSAAAAPPPSAGKNPAVSPASPSARPAPSSDILGKIKDATRGLVFTSETDAPVHPFAWTEDTTFSPEALRSHEGIDSSLPLHTEDIDQFFRNVTTSFDWQEDAEKEQVRKFTALRDLLKAVLTDVTVYRFGTTAIEVYVVGRDAGGAMVGIHTKVVET